MKPVVQFTTAGVWQQVYNEQRSAVVVDERSYIPIPAFELGFLFDSHILAVRALSTTALAHWRFAGNLYQRIQLGTGGAASSLPTVDASNKRIWLNRTILIDFPEYTPEYELNFTCAHWLRDVRLTVWQYIGINSDNITEKLLELETKIDVINEAVT